MAPPEELRPSRLNLDSIRLGLGVAGVKGDAGRDLSTRRGGCAPEEIERRSNEESSVSRSGEFGREVWKLSSVTGMS